MADNIIAPTGNSVLDSVSAALNNIVDVGAKAAGAYSTFLNGKYAAQVAKSQAAAQTTAATTLPTDANTAENYQQIILVIAAGTFLLLGGVWAVGKLK